MKILLVQAWLGRKQHPVLPLGLACIASPLGSHTLRIEDLNLSTSPIERLRSVLAEFMPDVVGFSLRNADTTSYTDRFSYIPRCLDQIELAGGLCPDAYILAGGAGFSIFAEEIMSHSPHIHCGIKGHGELVVEELVRDRAEGLFHGGGGGEVSPRLDLLRVESYTPFMKNLAVGIEVNRGCDLGCRYCSYSAVSGKIVMERPLELVRNDIKQITARGSSHVFLIAPILNNRRKRGQEVASMAASFSPRVTWEAYHSARGFDGEYASLISGSGCTAVSFSPDGGTAMQMKRMGKGYGPGELESAITAAAANDIQVSLNIFPWDGSGGITEMIQSFRNGVRWGRLAGEGLRRLRFGLIRRLPGTAFAPAGVSLEERIPLKEFVRPSASGMIVYRVLKKMCERDTVRA